MKELDGSYTLRGENDGAQAAREYWAVAEADEKVAGIETQFGNGALANCEPADFATMDYTTRTCYMASFETGFADMWEVLCAAHDADEG